MSRNPRMPHGFGLFIQDDTGSVYEGWMKYGRKEGHGRLVTNLGLVYEGNWEKKKIHGFGKLTYPDGSYYIGEFEKSQRTNNGMKLNFFISLGVLTVPSKGITYIGDFKDDQMDGKFILHMENGDQLFKVFKNGEEILENKLSIYRISDRSEKEGKYLAQALIRNGELVKHREDTIQSLKTSSDSNAFPLCEIPVSYDISYPKLILFYNSWAQYKKEGYLRTFVADLIFTKKFDSFRELVLEILPKEQLESLESMKRQEIQVPEVNECLVILERKEISFPDQEPRFYYDINTEVMIQELKFVQSLTSELIQGVSQQQVKTKWDSPIFSISEESVISNLNKLSQILKLDTICEKLCSKDGLEISEEEKQLIYQGTIVSDHSLLRNIGKSLLELTLNNCENLSEFLKETKIYQEIKQIFQNPPPKSKQEQERELDKMMGVKSEYQVTLQLLDQFDIKQLEKLNASEIEIVSQKCLSQFSSNQSLLYEYQKERYPLSHQPKQLKDLNWNEEDKEGGEPHDDQKKIELLKVVGSQDDCATWIAKERFEGRQEKIMIKKMNQKVFAEWNSLGVFQKEYEILQRIGKESVAIEMRNNWIEENEGKKIMYQTYTLSNGIQLVDYLQKLQNFEALKWTKYIFSRIIVALQGLHSKGIAHLGLTLDNIRIEFSENKSEMEMKFIDLKSAHYYGDNKIVESFFLPEGDLYKPPELSIFEANDFEAEKFDVFAAGNILLALFYNGFRNVQGPIQSLSKECYDGLIHQSRQHFWTAFFTQINHEVTLHPMADLQHLVEGMLNVDSAQRFTLQEVLDHDWFKSDVLTEGERLTEISNDRCQAEEKLLQQKVFEKAKIITVVHTPTQEEIAEVHFEEKQTIDAVLRFIGAVSTILGVDKCSHLIRTQYESSRAPKIMKYISTDGKSQSLELEIGGTDFQKLGQIAVTALLLNSMAHINVGDLEGSVDKFLNDSSIWTLLALNIGLELPNQYNRVRQLFNDYQEQMKKTILQNRDKPEIFKTLEMVIYLKQSIEHMLPSQHFMCHIGQIFSERQTDLENVYCEIKPLFILFYALESKVTISQIYENKTFRPVFQSNYTLGLFKKQVPKEKVQRKAEYHAHPIFHELKQSTSALEMKQCPSPFQQLPLHSQTSSKISSENDLRE